MKDYTQQEIWNIYEKLPEDLQKAVFSVENANYLQTICKRFDIEREKMRKIATLEGEVLMGLLTPKEFKISLQEEVGLNQEMAENVFRGINRFIFMPVRETLSALYGVEIEPTRKPEQLEGTEEEVSSQEKDTKPSEDRYREPIE